VLKEYDVEATKKSTARRVDFAADSTFNIRELLLNALSKEKRIWNESQNLLGSAGTGNL
jgi:hypothetical protein